MLVALAGSSCRLSHFLVVEDCAQKIPRNTENQAMKRSQCVRGLFIGLAISYFSLQPARAYSDRAIGDAEALLRVTTVRFSSGEVTAADLALAQYFLAEMKYRAGQMTGSAFCEAAKPYLTVISGDFEEETGQAGAKAKWQAAIASMTSSATDCNRAVAITGALLLGEREQAVTADDVHQAELLVDKLKDGVEEGTATRGDLEQAKFDLLTVQHARGLITDKQYCASGLGELQTIADATSADAQIGQSSLQDVIRTKRALYKFLAAC
jgi:hypothetical protein